jgi:hypothetical protein
MRRHAAGFVGRNGVAARVFQEPGANLHLQTISTYSPGNGRPRSPKLRTIDHRVGDYRLCAGRWDRITGIRADASSWLIEAASLGSWLN